MNSKWIISDLFCLENFSISMNHIVISNRRSIPGRGREFSLYWYCILTDS